MRWKNLVDKMGSDEYFDFYSSLPNRRSSRKKKIKKKTFSMGSPTLASALLTQQQVVDLSGVWTGTFSHCKQVHNKKILFKKRKKKVSSFFF